MSIQIIAENTAITNGISSSTKMVINNHDSECRVLDYGCGKLRNATHLLKYGYDVSIADTKKQLSKLSEDKVEQYNKIYTVDNDNITDKFDVVLCSFVINVIPQETERIKAINNIFKALDVGGCAYIEVRDKSFIKSAKTIQPYNDGYILGSGNIRTFQKGFDIEDLKQLIDKTHFKNYIIKKTNGGVMAICNK